jgi:hypothetical protein
VHIYLHAPSAVVSAFKECQNASRCLIYGLALLQFCPDVHTSALQVHCSSRLAGPRSTEDYLKFFSLQPGMSTVGIVTVEAVR